MPKKFDDMQKGILKSLRKQFPKMDEDELKSRSFAIAKDRMKKQGKGEKMDDKIIKEKKYDEDGHLIIAENVPLIITCNIEILEEEDDS